MPHESTVNHDEPFIDTNNDYRDVNRINNDKNITDNNSRIYATSSESGTSVGAAVQLLNSS